jgi:predicted Zn-dependent protease
MRYSTVLLVLLAACAVNPVTGRRELMLVSESQEISMGQQLLEQTRVETGFYPDQALEGYVQGIAVPMAKASERPDLPWEFHVIDEAGINAFAAPGGFIFITRGILAVLNSEAELAGVLGHEIGHVTARHSAAQMSTQQLLGVGLIAGSIAAPSAMGGALGQGLQAAAGLALLKYGRDDERQSDGLGHRYSLTQGYDVREMPKTFMTLRRVSESAGGGGGRMPGFLSTHPDPGDRVAATQAWADTVSDYSNLTAGRNGFLDHLDGLVYGEDPRQGYFENGRFLHPILKFQFVQPDGWQTLNQATRVIMADPNGQAQFEVSQVSQASAPEAAAAFVQQEGIQRAGSSRSPINGLPAASEDFVVQQANGQRIVGTATFVELGGAVYQLLGLRLSGAAQANIVAIDRVAKSFARTPANMTFRRVRELDVITLSRQMTLDALANASAGATSVDELALINGMEAGQMIVQGTRVKTVRWR